MPQLAPPPKFRAVGADGLALVGGKLFTYIEGTSTPKATYTSFTLGASNTNPVILDARGEADVWLDGAYKLVLKDSADVTIWTVDSIRDLTQNQTFTGATLAGTLTVSSTAVTWSGNPTHSGNHTFSGNVTVNGNTQLGNASTDTLRIDPNAVTWTNNPTHSGNHTFSGNVTASGTFSTAGNTTLGDAAADTLTVNATASFPLALSTHTFGINVGNASRATSTTLDYYDEGGWTPGMEFGGATTGWAFTGSVGKWTRIGRLVICAYHLVVSTKGSATGSCKMTGLPFNSVNGGLEVLGMGGEVSEFSGLLTNWISIAARVDQTGGTTLAKIYGTTAASASSIQLTDAAFQASAYLRGTFAYMTET